jgi:hypothetical protein
MEDISIEKEEPSRGKKNPCRAQNVFNFVARALLTRTSHATSRRASIRQGKRKIVIMIVYKKVQDRVSERKV